MSVVELRKSARRAFRLLVHAIGWCFLGGIATGASAETLPNALAKAYFNNPTLNAERASTRAADEAIPLASAGYRPTIRATGDVGTNYTEAHGVSASDAAASLNTASASRGTGLPVKDLRSRKTSSSVVTFPRGAALNVEQSLFNGLQTTNKVRSADAQMFRERETLRLVEESVLQSAAQAYMDVLRDTAVLDLRRNDLNLLEERLHEAHDKFRVGDATKTDVAQVEAHLAQGQAAYFAAQSNLQNSIASFRQVVGEQPTQLDPASPLQRGVPRSLDEAMAISQVEHPSIQAALFSVEDAELKVKIAEGALYPTLGVSGKTDQHFDGGSTPGSQAFGVSVIGHASVPIYSGGSDYAAIRQAKERVAAAETQAEVQRDNVRAAVTSAWGLLVASKAAVQASRTKESAAEFALQGTREEERVGQRTILDILNAEQTLLDTRISLVSAERDEIVASYSIVASTGRLSASVIGLKLRPYDPTIHFEQVKDKWFGLRTPDGR